MSGKEEPDEALLEGFDLSSLARPREATLRFIQVLRSDPVTRKFLDKSREESLSQPVSPPRREKRTEIEPDRSPEPVMTPSSATDMALVVDYANGMTQVEIAEKHGLHVQTIRKRLHAAGVDTRLRRRALSSADLQETQELLDSGLSSREAARKFGVSHTTLLRSLRRSDKA